MQVLDYANEGQVAFHYLDKGNTLILKITPDQSRSEMEFDNLGSKLFSTEELIEICQELTNYVGDVSTLVAPPIDSPLNLVGLSGNTSIRIERSKSDDYEVQVTLESCEDLPIVEVEYIQLTQWQLGLFYLYVTQIVDAYIQNEI